MKDNGRRGVMDTGAGGVMADVGTKNSVSGVLKRGNVRNVILASS